MVKSPNRRLWEAFPAGALETNLDRLVAVKVLPSETGTDPAFAERFGREARALAKLNHPGIVTVHDFGQSNGHSYFIMEYVEGVNLRQRLRAGTMPLHDILQFVGRICDALQYAHDKGIIHRDRRCRGPCDPGFSGGAGHRDRAEIHFPLAGLRGWPLR